MAVALVGLIDFAHAFLLVRWQDPSTWSSPTQETKAYTALQMGALTVSWPMIRVLAEIVQCKRKAGENRNRRASPQSKRHSSTSEQTDQPNKAGTKQARLLSDSLFPQLSFPSTTTSALAGLACWSGQQQDY